MHYSFHLSTLLGFMALTSAHPYTSLRAPVPVSPHLNRRAISQSILLANGKAAQKLNAKFKSMSSDSACETGDMACIAGAFSQCVSGKYVGSPCAATLKCFAMPLLLKEGTTLGCDSEADAQARIANTGASGGLTGDVSSSGAEPSVKSSNSPPASEKSSMETDGATDAAKPDEKLSSSSAPTDGTGVSTDTSKPEDKSSSSSDSTDAKTEPTGQTEPEKESGSGSDMKNNLNTSAGPNDSKASDSQALADDELKATAGQAQTTIAEQPAPDKNEADSGEETEDCDP